MVNDQSLDRLPVRQHFIATTGYFQKKIGLIDQNFRCFLGMVNMLLLTVLPQKTTKILVDKSDFF